jgi:hypothetical protein
MDTSDLMKLSVLGYNFADWVKQFKKAFKQPDGTYDYMAYFSQLNNPVGFFLLDGRLSVDEANVFLNSVVTSTINSIEVVGGKRQKGGCGPTCKMFILMFIFLLFMSSIDSSLAGISQDKLNDFKRKNPGVNLEKIPKPEGKKGLIWDTPPSDLEMAEWNSALNLQNELEKLISAAKSEAKSEEDQKIFAHKEKLVEMNNSSMEMEYMGYQTQFLHMCESASIQLKELVGKTGLNPKYILQAIQATDKYLEIEKLAVKEGFANDQMVHDFNMYLAIAHDTLNMLGYPDKELMYMTKHIKVISDLNLHRDTNYANDVISTVPTFGAGEANEGYNASDYKIVIGKDGQEYKVRSTRVVTDKNADGKPDGGVPVKETITMSKLRKKIAETYAPDPATVNRDVNMSSDKEVYHGIDKTIDGIGHEGKPVGMVSFKSFFATPETQKIETDKTAAMQDVHRAKASLAVHSSAYSLMKKVHRQDD